MMPSVKSALFKAPGASGNRAFFSFALVVGLVNLSLGLLGTFLTHAHPLFWAFVVSGIRHLVGSGRDAAGASRPSHRGTVACGNLDGNSVCVALSDSPLHGLELAMSSE